MCVYLQCNMFSIINGCEVGLVRLRCGVIDKSLLIDTVLRSCRRFHNNIQLYQFYLDLEVYRDNYLDKPNLKY